MGMPITIDIPNAHKSTIFGKCFVRLRQIDRKFSLYKPDSEASRYRRGEADTPSRELVRIIEECKIAEGETDGYFSAWADGEFDPSGYVKGWAISQAGKIIEDGGFDTYCVGAGGDILAKSDGQKIWKIGIQDPQDKTKILDLLSISSGSVATSGNYERGPHIINPKTKKPANELLSVTVTGPDMIKADVLATAIFAAGKTNPDFLKSFSDYSTLSVGMDGKIYKRANFHSPESNQ
jgi:thiamine biosynthesis lipoprotein